jgi:hypothetical protein
MKLITLTFIYCTCKFVKHKQSLLNENYEQSLPNKNCIQFKAHEKHKEGPTRHVKTRATSADSIPPLSL